MHSRLSVAALAVLAFSHSVTAAPKESRDFFGVSVRFPPTIDASKGPANWVPPPLGWDFGNWFQTNSSSPNSFQRNLQYSTLPIDFGKPDGPRTDLSSFQVTGNDTVFTSYGVDTPDPKFPAVYNYAGTGILNGATDSLEVIAWGFDSKGIEYRVSYSTFTAFSQTPASIDILSRTPNGPDANTLKKVQSQLVAFGNSDISALANSIGPAIHDSGRDGQLPILFCDAQCQTNKDLEALLGSA